MGSVTATPTSQIVGLPTSFEAAFNDGCSAVEEVEWSLGDGTVMTSSTSSPSSISYAFQDAAVHETVVRVTDACGNTGEGLVSTIAFLPDGVSVVGGGLIDDGTSRVRFDMSVRNHDGVTDGPLMFDLPMGRLVATGYDWLVVFSDAALLRGTGTLDGAGEYTFRVYAFPPTNTVEVKVWAGNVDTENSPPPPLFAISGTVSAGRIGVRTP